MLADELDYVVGVDTHRDEHALAVVDARTGALIAQATAAAAAAATRRRCDSRIDTRQARACGLSRAPATTVPASCGCFSAAASRYTKSNAASRAERRLRGKDDQLDAVRAARSALATKQRATPRAGQHQEALRLLLLARRSAVDTRRVALVQLRSVIVTAPDELRNELRRRPLGDLLKRCSSFRRSNSRTPDELATILVLRTLARRIQAATEEAETLEREILTHIRALVPQLLDEPGVGPIVAAQLIVTWSHQDRIASEAAFARLAGVAPVPTSSGLTTRHRLSRGGDRQLNRALHTIVLHRRQHDPATRDYIARRVSEGKSTRDAVRLLKRYLARHLYRVMQNSAPAMT